MRKKFLLALAPDRRYAIPARAALDSMAGRRCMSSGAGHCLDIVDGSTVYHCAAAALVVLIMHDASVRAPWSLTPTPCPRAAGLLSRQYGFHAD
jgi:hypothetical protein